MGGDQIIKCFEDSPELFKGANYIFHIIQSLVSIISQLAVSVAAAIIFYYIMEFINAKKRINDIVEIRKSVLFMLYNHMRILCHTQIFDKLNRDKKRLADRFKIFLIVDIPIFLECYNECETEKLHDELVDYFRSVESNAEEKENLIRNLQGFRKDIANLLEKKRFPFYKGYMQDIEELQAIYEELEGYTMIYKEEDENIDKLCCYEYIIEFYYFLLTDSVQTYCIMERYIECLEEKHVLEFIRMVD